MAPAISGDQVVEAVRWLARPGRDLTRRSHRGGLGCLAGHAASVAYAVVGGAMGKGDDTTMSSKS
jgi:hypothetical protein